MKNSELSDACWLDMDQGSIWPNWAGANLDSKLRRFEPVQVEVAGTIWDGDLSIPTIVLEVAQKAGLEPLFEPDNSEGTS